MVSQTPNTNPVPNHPNSYHIPENVSSEVIHSGYPWLIHWGAPRKFTNDATDATILLSFVNQDIFISNLK